MTITRKLGDDSGVVLSVLVRCCICHYRYVAVLYDDALSLSLLLGSDLWIKEGRKEEGVWVWLDYWIGLLDWIMLC